MKNRCLQEALQEPSPTAEFTRESHCRLQHVIRVLFGFYRQSTHTLISKQTGPLTWSSPVCFCSVQRRLRTSRTDDTTGRLEYFRFDVLFRARDKALGQILTRRNQSTSAGISTLYQFTPAQGLVPYSRVSPTELMHQTPHVGPHATAGAHTLL